MIKRRRSYTKKSVKIKKRTSRTSRTSRTRRRSRNFGPNIPQWLKDKLFKKAPAEIPVTHDRPEPASFSSLIEPILGLKSDTEKTYFDGVKNYIDTAVGQFIIPPSDDKNFTFKQKAMKWFLKTKLGKKYVINLLKNLIYDVEKNDDKSLNQLVRLALP